jgi:tetratricopeptide (TPR) repeat protein
LKKILITVLLTNLALCLVGQSLYDRSVKELNKGDTIQALRLLEDLLQNDPQNIKGYYLRANILIDKNKLDEGISDLDILLKIEPDNKDALRKRTLAKWLKGDNKGTMEDIDRRINLDPTNSRTYYEKGFYYFLVEKWESAIESYTQAILLDSTYKEAYAARGNVKIKKIFAKRDLDPDEIERASACTDFKKAMELGYDSADMLRHYCEQ